MFGCSSLHSVLGCAFMVCTLYHAVTRTASAYVHTLSKVGSMSIMHRCSHA